MEWYRVSFDERGVTRAAQPPGGTAWEDQVAWDTIARVCLEMEGLFGSDSLYLFTRQRPESYVVPLTARGAPELLGELIRRGLFDGELAIRAASAEGLFVGSHRTVDGHFRDHG
jgi:hypothetical protein